MGVTATFQRMTQFGLLLSCDSDLKSDWVFRLSGSGSNSLNSQKLPGHFSSQNGLGTRLGHIRRALKRALCILVSTEHNCFDHEHYIIFDHVRRATALLVGVATPVATRCSATGTVWS